ncbi:phosphoribosylpyrophosphate synthetase [Terrimonas sp. NA20]|uniref:Phosphoribosylpyrophosphate synthetase n=1 Tax=Terrimonas ginsenosidimutans TaxID=2908004 RepID=A0ABS9KTT4_9BACT|nr:phosphoribosylpyrophosphate synthetase [Terrimonas ginsenosidimutans]MCG2615747.1 phosphoribosylpyrophosphate synthetase [Terrimonas ginsenosidimutans]
MKNYGSVQDAISDLENRGYTESFEEDEHCLYCQDLRLRLAPEEFKVDEVYHFGTKAGEEAGCLLYAISSSEGLKGVLLAEPGREQG